MEYVRRATPPLEVLHDLVSVRVRVRNRVRVRVRVRRSCMTCTILAQKEAGIAHRSVRICVSSAWEIWGDIREMGDLGLGDIGRH